MTGPRPGPAEGLTAAQATRYWAAIAALTEALEQALRRSTLTAFRSMRAQLAVTDVAAVLAESGAAGVVTAVLGPTADAAAFDALRSAVQDATWTAAQAAARVVTDPAFEGAAELVVRLDRYSPAAVNAVQAAVDRWVPASIEDARAGLRAAVERGLAEGINPREMARRVQAALGLDPTAERAIANYRAALASGDRAALRQALQRALRDRRYDRTVQAALRASGPVPAAKLEQLVGAYARRMRAHRAETLARTVALDAYHRGQRLVWEELFRTGVAPRGGVRRYWVVARDERTCPRCVTIPTLNPDGRGFDELFLTPEDGRVLTPALHYRCRCVIWTRPARS